MKKNLLTIWVKRAVPALALAGVAGLTLPSCEKEPEQIKQHDEEIFYYSDNNNNPRLNLDTIRSYANSEKVRFIYITVANGKQFISWNSNGISSIRYELQLVKDISSKVKGRGNFEFTPGVCTYGDSLDFVAMGFTINQQNQR